MKDQGLDEEKVAQMMEANARNVYDVLDENGFVISMNWDMAFNKFSYHINDDQYKLLYDSRKEAESAAVNVAIHRLQNKLNPQPSAEVYEDEFISSLNQVGSGKKFAFAFCLICPLKFAS